MNYDVNYFISKFEAIPEDKWCVGELISITGKRCAYGHCATDMHKPSVCGRSFNEESRKFTLLEKYLKNDISFGEVNDGTDPNYQQSTPKQRILAALYDIKRIQQPIQTLPDLQPITFTQIQQQNNIPQSVN